MGTIGNEVCPFTGGKFAAIAQHSDGWRSVDTPIFPDAVEVSDDLYEELLGIPASDKIGLRRWIADMFDLGTPPPTLTHQHLAEYREHPEPSPEVKAYRLLGWMVAERSRLKDPSEKFDFKTSRVNSNHEACLVTESESGEELDEPLGILHQLGYVDYLGPKNVVVPEPQLVIQVTSAGRENAGQLPPEILRSLRTKVLSERPTPFEGELLPRVHSDRAHGIDTVGVTRDAASLARVIADRSVEPPLAIGLFGEWGSGKSYFMYLMRDEIKQISELPNADFCHGIVQIDFNAWHYVEVNLWASLVDNILSGLHDWLTGHGKSDKAKVLLSGLETAKRAKKEALDELHDAKTDVIARAEDLDAARGSLERELNLSRLMDRKAWQQVDYNRLPKELQERLKEVAGIVGDGKKAEELWELASQAGGGINDLLLSFRKLDCWGKFVAVCGFVALVSIVTYGPDLLEQWKVSAVSQVAASIVAAVTGSAASIRLLLSSGRQSIALAQSVRDALQSKNEEHLATFERELAAAEQRVAEAQAKVAEAEKAIAAENPRTLIAAFIKRLMTSGDYSRQLGIVASIRRDFEALEQLLGVAEDIDDSGPGKVVDRIVLYIDDLDRCPSPRVVQVLEAINLLLAFKIFVVVVGVDVRWITKSLLEHYGTHLSDEACPSGSEKNLVPSRSLQASPHDYLEKIFQIPFWLQPIDEQAAHRYLTALIDPPDSREASASAEPDVAVPRESATESDLTVDFASGSSAASESGLDQGDEFQDPGLYGPVSFELKERNFLLEMGEAAGTSPRRLKRFLNTYRVIKASVPTAERNGFVREVGGVCAYRAVLALLAIGTGFPELARQLSAKVAVGDLATALRSIADESSQQSGEQRRARKALVELRKLADNPRGIDMLRTWYPRVSRFTFELGARLSSLEVSGIGPGSDRPSRRRPPRAKPAS